MYGTWPILNTSCKFPKEKLGVCIGEEAVGFRDTTSGALLWVPRPGEHRGGRDLHLQTINVTELCTIVYISMHTCLLGTLNTKKDAVIVWETTLHKLAKDIKALRVL